MNLSWSLQINSHRGWSVTAESELCLASCRLVGYFFPNGPCWRIPDAVVIHWWCVSGFRILWGLLWGLWLENGINWHQSRGAPKPHESRVIIEQK